MCKKTVLKIFKRHSVECTPITFFFILVGFLFSLILLMLLHNDMDEYVSLSVIFCPLLFIIVMFGIGINLYIAEFKNVVKMGIARKVYLTAAFLFFTSVSAAGIILTYIFTAIESAIASTLFGLTVKNNETLIELIQKTILPFIVGSFILFAICIFAGAIIMRFAMKGAAVLYFIFIFNMILFPRYVEQVINIFFDKNANFMSSDLFILLLIAIALSLAAIIYSLRVYMKIEIK